MVRDILRQHRLTRRQLAEALGVARVTVQNWEHGRRNPSALAKFALRLIHMHGLNALLSGELKPIERKPLDCKLSKGSKAKTQ